MTARVIEERPIGAQEASGVARLPDGRFLVVDDEHGVFVCAEGEDASPLDAGKGLADLEGICIDPSGRHVFLLAERDGSVWRFDVGVDGIENGKRRGKLPRLNKRKNSGWEGIAFSPAGTFAADAELVAVHQAKPRVIGFFDADTLAERVTLRLPKAARKVAGDLHDIAIHPTTHHLFVVSGKAGKLLELAVDGEDLDLVRTFPLDTQRGDVPEGATFDDDGTLWVVTDGEGMLREIALQR